MKSNVSKWMIAWTVALLFVFAAVESFAIPMPTVQVGIEDIEGPAQMSSALQVLLLLTVLALAPSILIMMTSFSRIIIVLAFLRQAMGTQQTPPTQILIGLGLFLTLFVMAPVWTEINDNALKPYLSEQLCGPLATFGFAAPLQLHDKFHIFQRR